jgi:hypothetical protein
MEMDSRPGGARVPSRRQDSHDYTPRRRPRRVHGAIKAYHARMRPCPIRIYIRIYIRSSVAFE